MSKTAEKESKVTFVRENKIFGSITIPVVGRARTFVDNDGTVFTEIEYEVELMNKAIDRELLPILEEATGINHCRSAYDKTPLKTSGVLLAFRNSVRDKDLCFKFMKENKK